MNARKVCPTCKGSGRNPVIPSIACVRCFGQGWLRLVHFTIHPALPSSPNMAVPVLKGASPHHKSKPTWPFVPLGAVECKDEDILWQIVRSAGVLSDALLAFTFDSSGDITQMFKGASVWKISHVDGADHVPLSPLDRIAELCETHFGRGPGRVVVLPGLDLLAEANDVLTVVRVLSIVRDLAQLTSGTVLASLNPKTLSEQDIARLERKASMVAVPRGS